VAFWYAADDAWANECSLSGRRYARAGEVSLEPAGDESLLGVIGIK
jgi:hypothetical protein